MLLHNPCRDDVMMSPLQPTTRLQEMLWASNVQTKDSFPIDTATCTKGQLKLVLCGTSTKLTLTVLGLRSLPQSCISNNVPTFVYLKMSLYPDQDNRVRHKTDVMPVERDVVTLHDSFSFNVGRRECNRRLLISAWCRHGDRYSGPSSFIGCMSFGIRKLVAKQEVMQGWYYFLSESLGRKKHLTSKHISEDAYPENCLRSSTLHVRTVNVFPSDESTSSSSSSVVSHSFGRDAMNMGSGAYWLQTDSNRKEHNSGKKRVLGDLPLAPKRRRLCVDEQPAKREMSDFTVGVAVGKRSSDAAGGASHQRGRHTAGRTPTGRRHVRRKSYSSTDLVALHEAYYSEYTASGKIANDDKLRNAALRVQESSSAKIVKQTRVVAEPMEHFVVASLVSNRSSNVARRRRLNDAPAPSQRPVSCYGNPEVTQFPEHVVEQVALGLRKGKDAGPRSADFADVGYHSETTSTSSGCTSSSDTDSTSSSSEEECHQVAKAVESRPAVAFAKNLPTKAVKKSVPPGGAVEAVEIEARKPVTMRNLKTWFNRKPDNPTIVERQEAQRKTGTPTKSLSTGWLFRYKSAADQAISRQLKRSNSLRQDTKKNCDYCSVSSKQLADVLKTKGGVEAFKAFLKGEYSDENLEFWLECEAYKNAKPHRRHKMAPKIFERFIQSGSPDEVNIDNETRKATEDGLSLAGPDAFGAAQQRIFDLMSRDSYRRFQMSELRKCKCRHIG